MRQPLFRPLRPPERRGVARFPAPVLAAVMAMVVAACGASIATPAPSQQAPSARASIAGPAVTIQPVVTFPLILTDDEGNKVSLAALPRAIVSLTPAVTETLYALGVGDRLVGKVEDFAVFPPEAAKVPDVAKFGSIDVERIVALKADLVIAGGNDFNPPAEVARLRTLGIPVLTIYGPNLAATLADIELIGKAVGRASQAAALVADLKAAFIRVQDAVKGLGRPRVYYELDASNGYWGPAPDYFGVEMIQLAGGIPLTSGTAGAFQIPEEKIIAFDPEVILLGDAAYGMTPEQVIARGPWAGLTAVKTRAIRPVDDVVITRPGPRLGLGLAVLARAIHPGVVLVTASPSKAP